MPPVVNTPPRARSSGNLRFVWQADPQTKFIHVSEGLAEAVGPMAADILGRGWAEISHSVAQDASGEIAELFARQETWSGRTIQWRVDNKSGTVPVDLAGMPILGTERELVGFRGFGLIRKDALDDLADDEQPRDASPPAIAEIDAGATGTAAQPVAKGNLSSNSAELSDEAKATPKNRLSSSGQPRPASGPGPEAVSSRMEDPMADRKQPVSNLSLRRRRKPSEISPTTRNSSSNFAKQSQPRYPNRPSSFTALPRLKTRRKPSQRP